jgi:hypothetical protein
MTLLDRAWKRAVAHFKQDSNSRAEPPAAVGSAA